MPDYKIIEINDSNISILQDMANESTLDGDLFIQKTIDEWRSGVNTFSKPSEKLWGLTIDDEIIGLGGLNQDPYTENPEVGRVRHVYIMKKYRGLGLSKILMKLIINRAKQHFTSLRLSTKNPVAISLYESLGFEKTEEHKATHIIKDLSK
ncbi:MAG: GNAT family N-acetyltransferase [Candidatus Paceibacterota bacterium]